MLSLAFLVFLLFDYHIKKPDIHFLSPFSLNDGHAILYVFFFFFCTS
jgi:hypothetical protein